VTYRVASFGGEAVAFDDGTSVLLAGPTNPTDDHLYDLVAGGPDEGDVAIVVTTNRTADQVVSALERRDASGAERLGVVDVASDDGGSVDGARVRTLGSPGDLTGLSVEFAKLLESFNESDGDVDRVRVGVSTVSTLLMYAEVRTVFRFLHVFTSRIGSADMLGGFTVTPGMHDDQTVNTVRTIFDCEARVGDDDLALSGTGYERE